MSGHRDVVRPTHAVHGFPWRSGTTRSLDTGVKMPSTWERVQLAATVLAWMWLERNGGGEGSDMTKKAGEWVGMQLGAKNTEAEKEALKMRLLTIIPLS